MYADTKPEKHLQLSNGGFMRFRSKMAELHGGPWHKLYQDVIRPPLFLSTDSAKRYWSGLNREANDLIARHRVSKKLVDFCLQPDGDGHVSYGTCAMLLRLANNHDDPYWNYGYTGMPGHTTFSDIKELLQECVSKRCGLKWDG